MARSIQWFILGTALLLWAAWPTANGWTLVAAYGVAWLLAQLIEARGRGLDWPRRVQWLALALVIVVPASAAYRHRDSWVRSEGFRGLAAHLGDRGRLTDAPSIYPSIVFHDRPQTFYVWAPGAEQVAARFGSSASLLPATGLGEGLFRVRFDPRTDGQGLTEDGALQVALIDGSRAYERDLAQVHPLAHPRWFASAPDVGRAAVASEETDEVFVVSRDGLETTLSTGDGPSDVVFVDGGSSVAISHRWGRELWVLAADGGGSARRLELGAFQHRLAVSPGGRELVVAVPDRSPRLELLTVEPLARTGTLPLAFRPDWVAFGRDRDELIVSSREERALHRFNRSPAGTWVEAPVHLLGRPVATMARSVDGTTLFAAVTDYSADGKARTGNHFIQDQILEIDLATWTIRDRIFTQRRTNRQTRAGSIDSGASPLGIAPRADGSLLVAFAGSEEVWTIPQGAHHPSTVISGHGLDLASPHGVADLGDGFWAASSAAGGALAIYDPSGEIVKFVGVSPTDSELRAAPEGSTRRLALELRAGERAFYEATRTGISCQSCHLHGDTDHTAHNIGQRPLLPTLTVRGIRGTSPYLRDGSFPRIRDLDSHLARTLYRGYVRRFARRGEALEAFVESLPPTANPLMPDARDLERERAGLRQFTRAGCDLCHAFPAFTNLSRHPVRALFPEYGAKQLRTSLLDTPSLLGTHARSHFLQDGRAHDLEDVLETENASNRHGNTAELDAADRSALIHLLESL